MTIGELLLDLQRRLADGTLSSDALVLPCDPDDHLPQLTVKRIRVAPLAVYRTAEWDTYWVTAAVKGNFGQDLSQQAIGIWWE